jgi:hypothetical protein
MNEVCSCPVDMVNLVLGTLAKAGLVFILLLTCFGLSYAMFVSIRDERRKELEAQRKAKEDDV